MMLEMVKIFLSINDDLQDELLEQIILDMTQQVLGYTGLEELPPDLEWIVRELTIIRFNRIGSEGMKSETEEGKRMDFADDPLLAYEEYLDKWIIDVPIVGTGKAKFL